MTDSAQAAAGHRTPLHARIRWVTIGLNSTALVLIAVMLLAFAARKLNLPEPGTSAIASELGTYGAAGVISLVVLVYAFPFIAVLNIINAVFFIRSGRPSVVQDRGQKA